MCSPFRGLSVLHESDLADAGSGVTQQVWLPGLQWSEQYEPFSFFPSAKILSIKLLLPFFSSTIYLNGKGEFNQGWGIFVCVLSRVGPFATPWTVTHQVPLSMELSRQDTGVGCHALFQGKFLSSVIEPSYLVSPALAGRFFMPVPLGKTLGSFLV